MAYPKIEQEELVEKLFEVFRELGYDGTSLMQLSAATGLQKASLYHRFPRGKEEMVEMVLAHADRWLEAHVVSVLKSDGDPLNRLQEALGQLDIFYGKGQKACLLRTLSLGTAAGLFQRQVQRSFAHLREGFQAVSTDLGLPEAQAQQAAENTLIRIQGALLLAGATQEPALFERTLGAILQEATLLQSPQK
jgi:AcrR family transcriptional regulator